MIDSARATAIDMPEVICWVDDDDPSYIDGHFPEVKFTRGPRPIMSDAWNLLLPHATKDIFMLCGDDCIFKTPGWDKMVEDAFAEVPDKILMVFGDDGGPNGKIFATHPFVHRRWVEIIGYFTGPGYSCDYADAHPQDVATEIGRKKYLPFENEHLHPVFHKAPYDEVYKESNARLHRDNTPQMYADRHPERQRDANTLLKYIEDFKNGKAK